MKGKIQSIRKVANSEIDKEKKVEKRHTYYERERLSLVSLVHHPLPVAGFLSLRVFHRRMYQSWGYSSGSF